MRKGMLALFIVFLVLNCSANDKWSFDAGSGVSTPVVASGDSLIFGTYGGTVYSIDARNQRELWSHSMENVIDAGPEISGSRVFMGDRSGNIVCLNKGSGQQIWNFKATKIIDEETNQTDPMRVAGIYAEGSFVYVSTEGMLYKFSVSDGSPQWEVETGEDVSPPVVSGNRAYLVADGVLMGIDIANGGKRLEIEVGETWKARPALEGNNAYIGNLREQVVAVDTNAKEVDWAYHALGWVLTTPVVYSGSILAGSNNGYAYSINPGNGEPNWVTEISSGAVGTPLVFIPDLGSALVIFSSNDGTLSAIEHQSGKMKWSYQLPDTIGTPESYGDYIVVGSEDGKVYGVYTTTCSITEPEGGDLIGESEVEIIGNAYSERGIGRVQVRVNGRGWEEAEGTEEWVYALDPREYAFGEVTLECRVIDSRGQSEPQPYHKMSVQKSRNAPEGRMLVGHPLEVEGGEEFTVDVRSVHNRSLQDVKVEFKGETYTGDGKVKIPSGEEGGYHSLVVERTGYQPYEAEMNVVVQSNLPLYIAGGVAVVFIAVVIYIWRFSTTERKEDVPPEAVPSGMKDDKELLKHHLEDKKQEEIAEMEKEESREGKGKGKKKK